MKAIIANDLEKTMVKIQFEGIHDKPKSLSSKKMAYPCMNTWIIPFHTRLRERNIKAS